MVTAADMAEALSQLRLSKTIPGLDKDSLVDVYVETEFKDSLDACETEEDRQRRKDRFVEYYITGPGTRFIEENIANLQFAYSQVVDGINSLQRSAEQVTASNAVPSVITTGSATSTPNPAYTAIDNAQKKRALLVQITTITACVASMLGYAVLLHFELPDAAFALVGTLGVVASIINAIPG